MRHTASVDVSPWDPVDRLVGIGPKLSSALADCGIHRIVDLLFHLPLRYEDRSQVLALDTPWVADRWVLVHGTVEKVTSYRARRRRMRVVRGIVADGRGALPVVWFNQPWVEERLQGAGTVSLYGPIRRARKGGSQLVNPEINDIEEGDDERIVPVYPAAGPLKGRRLRGLIAQCLPAIDACSDPLPDHTRRAAAAGLDLQSALRQLHNPELTADETECALLVDALNRRRTPAHRRLAFDELLAFNCMLAEKRSLRCRQRSPECRIGDSYRELERCVLPFELTTAQRRVVHEIEVDLSRPHPMARLIQGDVGSGKTVVAALAAIMMVEAGHQVALMAPTELLAEQHARTLSSLFRGTHVDVHMLTSSLPGAEQREVRSGLDDGSVRMVVGTHSLFQESVRFRDLGLVVIDEQHRFGVTHRQALVDKGTAPNLLVMTATPIPRSLALTVYGDLDLSVIDELPPGRRPVTTVIRGVGEKDKLFAFLRQEIEQGGRAYFVYPAIEVSEDYDAPALEEHRDAVQEMLPGVSLGMLHGRMTRDRRERIYRDFSKGIVQVLLATTVVEVGVDVPEASMMIIEGADRFGLSQLHQMRGRVGRGSRKAWCVLIADDLASEEARRRLDVLCSTTDGFEIAEADLALRGPGELTGTRQWGPGSFRFADLVRNRDLLRRARDAARELSDSGRLGMVREELARYHAIDVHFPVG